MIVPTKGGVVGKRRMRVFDDKSRFLDRFGLLLIVTTLSIVMLMLVNVGPGIDAVTGRWEATLATVLVGATLLLALRASGLARRYQLIADVVVVLLVTSIGSLAVLASISDSIPPPTRALPPVVVILAVAAPLAVVRRISKHRQVTRGTLLGAISGYLLIPIAFVYLFLTLSAVTDQPFFGEPRPTTDYMYFSLTTITTTGYGDMIAVSNPGRLLAMSEALIGQVYLVTFVALLVGLYASQRLQRRGS